MFKDILQQDILLAPYTTYQVGGKAKYFAIIEDEETLLESLAWAKDNNLDIFILGGGSNILVNDDGFDGLVLKMHNIKKEIKETDEGYICTLGSGLS
jgi:UDP-N-acetylenolpyruvoylglucosamine reductase